MPTAKRTIEIYEELAELEDRRENPQMCDRFLILAADAALRHGLRDEAERLRARLLEHNPHHLLRPYSSLAEAMKSPDVSNYIVDLRDTYPPEHAGRLLAEGQGDGKTTVTPAPAEPEEVAQPHIYSFTEATDEEPTEVANESLASPEPPAPPRRLRPVADAPTPAATPEVFPYPVETPSPRHHRRRTAEPEEPPSGLGVCVSNVLFGIVLLAGMALLVYTLAGPFLPL
jgi:hypothetical protein